MRSTRVILPVAVATVVLVSTLLGSCSTGTDTGTARPVRGSETTVPALPSPSSTVSAPPSPSTSQPEPDGGLLAIDVLGTILVAREMPVGYDRDLFGGWLDLDGDGCSTREEVLIRDSLTPAQIDPFGCAVVAGDWFSIYEGQSWTDPSDVDIDHVVALKEAWDSGAHAWTERRRRSFANDLEDRRSLRAVTDDVNQSKGDADPSNWLPSREEQLCTYVSDWIAIKARWGLSMDESEHGRLRKILEGRCLGTTLAPWP